MTCEGLDVRLRRESPDGEAKQHDDMDCGADQMEHPLTVDELRLREA